jgi:hypothetical protein
MMKNNVCSACASNMTAARCKHMLAAHVVFLPVVLLSEKYPKN